MADGTSCRGTAGEFIGGVMKHVNIVGRILVRALRNEGLPYPRWRGAGASYHVHHGCHPPARVLLQELRARFRCGKQDLQSRRANPGRQGSVREGRGCTGWNRARVPGLRAARGCAWPRVRSEGCALRVRILRRASTNVYSRVRWNHRARQVCLPRLRPDLPPEGIHVRSRALSVRSRPSFHSRMLTDFNFRVLSMSIERASCFRTRALVKLEG